MTSTPRFPALLAAALAAGLAGLPASAQTLKPGLWDMTSKMSSSDPQVQAAMQQMQQQMANMPAAQRQAMEKAMRQHGVQMDFGPNGAMHTKTCMTREMVERQEWPVHQGQCTQKTTQLSPSRVKVAFSCTKPEVSGESDVTVDSSTHYRAHAIFTASPGQNAPAQHTQADIDATWLSADCGSVRPIPIPQQ
jgi:hypothetical protein